MATDRAATLGAPLAIRGVQLRNRVVGAPMERNYSDLAGRATPQYAAYLAARAEGGAALLFTEASYVRGDSKARRHQAGMHDDAVLPGLRRIAEAVHAHGALLGVEVNHAGRVVPSAVSLTRPVGPSPVACVEIGGEVPRELSTSEVDAVVTAFADGARRAVRGGADVVSVHGAHGYLIGQFVSPRSNHRSDRYAVRTALLDEVLLAVRDAVGDDVPVFLRWSAFEGLPGGLDRDESLRTLSGARLDLVDVLDLSAGTYGAGHWITPSGEVAEGYLGPLARRYREETGLAVSLAGRITRPETARRLVSDGDVDLVSLARALHADPAWTDHALAGTEPRPCISCNQGCADVIFTGAPLWCTVNPRTGHEGEPAPPQARPGLAPVVVVGGGPSGMQAAVTLAERGARVTLKERDSALGGQLRFAADCRAKPQFVRILRWYEKRLADLGVEVELGADVRRAPAGAVVVDATGGDDYVPIGISAHDREVVGIRSWWASGRHAESGPVTVWGADRVAVFVADEIASRGRAVSIVARQSELAPDAGARERLHAVDRLLADDRVSLELGATLEECRSDTVVVSVDGAEREVPAPGPVIASLGVVPRGLPDPHEAARVVRVGEADGAAGLDAAIASGDRAARALLLTLASTAHDVGHAG